MERRHFRLITLAACLFLPFLLLLRPGSPPGFAGHAAGELPDPLRRKADARLSKRLAASGASAAVAQCQPGNFGFELHNLDYVGAETFLMRNAVWANVSGIPCRWQATFAEPACCRHRFSFRLDSTDIRVFHQIFRRHFFRFLYTLFAKQPPKYILDAGANAGFSTTLFKLLYPNATVVALEPDPDNFAALQRNTAGLGNVHTLQAGLWGRRANITLAESSGDWGNVFREASHGEAGMPAYSVKDIAKMFDIPHFDFAKIDIEGGEGMVFGQGADISWVLDTKLISLELHDKQAPFFGLTAVSPLVEAAFTTTEYTMAADNEHLFFISPYLLAQLPDPS